MPQRHKERPPHALKGEEARRSARSHHPSRLRNHERKQPAKSQIQKRLEDRVWHRRQQAKSHKLRIVRRFHVRSMNRRFFLASLSACAVLPRASGAADFPELSANELVEFTPISQGVSRASTLILYEGLPHPLREAEQFKRELATKKTVRFHDYPFYEGPLHVAANDIGTLRRLSANPDSYWSYGGPKLCGGYHPDYCLAWRTRTRFTTF
jgi:hypothetical protein